MTVIQHTPAQTWQLDPIHSSAAFEVRHSGVSIFRGGFGKVDATLSFDDGVPALTGAVDVASISVPDENLTAHLLAPDFFDAERYPEITFVSAAAQPNDDGSVAIEGDLTIKGRTERVKAQGSIAHVDADISGGERYGVSIETTIDRRAFGVDWNSELPGGGLYLENDVKLVVNLEFTPRP
jgi:polyisoprenoid-binding protein YceI